MITENKIQECVTYFRSRKGFQRAFEGMKAKWRSFGAVKGTVTLTSCSKEERDALGGFFSCTFSSPMIRFSLKQFETALNATKYAGIPLNDLLNAYFEESLVSNKEVKDSLKETRLSQIELLQNEASSIGGEMALCWISSLEPSSLSRILRGFKEEEEGLKAIIQCAAALSVVEQFGPQESIPLSQLSMDFFGNPHALDKTEPAGKLFLKALQYGSSETNEVGSAEEVLQLYIDHGIRPDDISSFTVLQGIHLYEGDAVHPAYEAHIEKKEFFLVSLSQLSGITKAIPKNQKVYLIENQMVFSRIASACPEASLMCTSGQLKTASLLMADLLCQSEAELYYCGDIDPEGLLIADKLIRRSHNRIIPWHMEPSDYEESISSVSLNESRLAKLRHLETDCLKKTADCVIAEQRAGYQEKLMDVMIREIRESLL